MTSVMRGAALAAAVAVVALLPRTAVAQQCANHGELDNIYCDENRNLVADPPVDPRAWKNPPTLNFTYTPVEDPTVYQYAFRPFTDHLGTCTGRRVIYYPVQSNAAEINAMRSGRLHIAGFSTGPTGFAVNFAGAVPFAVKGNVQELQGYNLIAVVKASSPYFKLSDLKGRRVAHTSPASNSGNLAPRVLFPPEGLRAGRRLSALDVGWARQVGAGGRVG